MRPWDVLHAALIRNQLVVDLDTVHVRICYYFRIAIFSFNNKSCSYIHVHTASYSLGQLGRNSFTADSFYIQCIQANITYACIVASLVAMVVQIARLLARTTHAAALYFSYPYYSAT